MVHPDKSQMTMKNELTVEKNINVSIQGFYQWPIYRGLLEGVPYNIKNDRILKGVPDDAKKLCGDKPVHIIEPTQTPIPYEGRHPLGVPMSLPPIICVADLICFQPVRVFGEATVLIVVWFQNEYAFPIDIDIINKLKKLPWSKLADEFGF